MPIPKVTVLTAVACSQIRLQCPRTVLLTGIAGSTKPVVVKVVAVMPVTDVNATELPARTGSEVVTSVPLSVMLDAAGAVPAPPLFGRTLAVIREDPAIAVVLEAYRKPPEVKLVG
jgi:hypothetical protein